MPKNKLKKFGEETRISRGKWATEINFDISEQCVDEEKVPLNCDEENQPKSDEKSLKVDSRTFEEIMFDAFDEFNSKSYQIRTNALRTICSQLQQCHNPDFLIEHYERLLIIISNALNAYNVHCEIDAAANLLSLVAIQLFQLPQLPTMSFQMFYERLEAALSDEYLKTSIRYSVFRAMAILTFLYEAYSYKISLVMKRFRDIIVSKKTNKINYETQISAFESWIFLLTLVPSRLQCSQPIGPFFRTSFFDLLESPCYGIRVACTKAIAVIFECGDEKDKEVIERRSTKTITQISEISRAWNKRTSEIKSPEEVLRYFETGMTPHRELKNEKCVLILDNWALNVQYEMLRDVIGSANVAKHLAKNERLLTRINMAQSTKMSTFSPKLKDTPSQFVNEPCRLTSTPAQPKGYDVEKLTKNLYLATVKSSMERTKALEGICKELHLVPETVLAEHKSVILDIVVKAMKRGDETEQLPAVRLATLTVFRIGRKERFCSEISNLFLNYLKQTSTSIPINTTLCTALAFIELVDSEHVNRTFFEPAMNLFKQIFNGTQPHNKTLKGDGTNEQLFRTKALEAWALLLTLCSPKEVCSIVKSQMIKELTEMLLNDSNVEFRIICGQVISLIIEKGRISETNYLKSDIPDICNAIKNIINDRRNISSDKRKLQNAKLREILKYLEDECHPTFKLQFAQEIHELKTWSSIFKHQKLSQFIGSDLAIYIEGNERIRGIIQISSKPVVEMFQLQPNTQYKLSSAAKKKLKTKENRLNGRTPKFGYL